MGLLEDAAALVKRANALAGRCAALWSRHRWLEALVIVVLLLWALLSGGLKMSPNWQERTFYQYEFGPAVMYACGHGLRAEPQQTDLKSFLDVKQQSLDCAQIEAPDRDAVLNPFQAGHRYLLQAMGVAWQVWGVDWRVADHLVVGLYALTCVLAYLLLRVFLPTIWSIAGVWLYATAGTHLIYLDSLRDYAKAPFVLAVLACLGWYLKRRHTVSQEGGIAVLMGCALGLGLGFRMDLLVFVPFVIGMLILFYPAPLTQGWTSRLLMPLVVVSVAYACAFPVLSAMAKGSNTAHVILLGLSHDFGELLGLYSADHQFASYYNDAYQQVQIDTLAAIQGEARQLEFSSTTYETFGYRLLREYLNLFPADLWLRGMAAIVEGIGYDFNLRVGLAGGAALTVAALAILGLCVYSRRLGLAFAVAVAFLFAFPALQFNLRHFFYLSIVPILCAGLSVHSIRSWLWGKRSWPAPLPGLDRRLLVPLAVAGLALAVPMLVWLTLLPVQFAKQADMLQRMKALPVDWVSPAQGSHAGGAPVQLTSAQLGSELKARLRHDPRGDADNVRVGYYWVIDVDQHRTGCPTDRIRGAIRYRASSTYYDFTRTFSYIIDGAVRIFLPVVEIRQKVGQQVTTTTLDSLVVDALPWECIVRVGSALPDSSAPWLVDVVVPLDTGRTHLRPALPNWIAGERPLHHTVAASPSVPAAAQMEMLQWRGADKSLSLGAADALGGSAVSLTPNGMRMNGAVEGRYAYLLRTDEVEFRRGDVLKASGVLEQGGLTVGLVKDGAWAHQLSVVRPGEFDLFFMPEPGQYRLVIANNLARSGSANAFEIKRLDWVHPPE